MPQTDPNHTKARQIILDRLHQGDLGIDESTELLYRNGIKYPRTTAKYVSWEMVEDCVAFFNKKWKLQLGNGGDSGL